MVGLSSLAPITTAAGALGGLILVSPQDTVGYQPQNPDNDDGTPSTAPQPAALLFHYDGEQSIQLTADITDHFVEDNTAVQDQIALHPEQITVKGYIGELNDVPDAALAILKQAAQKLTLINSYVPGLSDAALLAYQEAFFLEQSALSLAHSAVSAWKSVGNLIDGSNGQSVIDSEGLKVSDSPQNKQQTMFQQLYGYWSNRTLFTVQTPWCVFEDMAILSLRAVQGEDTDQITDFEITFKRIRVAETLTYSGVITSIASGRLGAQGSQLQNNGSGAPGDTGPSVGEGLGVMGAPPP